MSVAPLSARLTQYGSDPALLGKELLAEIRRAIQDHPRSQQVEIGPSEVGHPCARRIGYKLLGFPERESTPNWKATIGTALHTWLEDHVVAPFNARHPRDEQRFIAEETLYCGQIGAQPLLGHCDLLDRVTGTVVDWKSVGPTQLKKYKSKGPGDQYRSQAHIYGRGWAMRGFDVQRVAVMFLPRNGELAESYFWSEDYDEQIALDAIQRATGIKIAVDVQGPNALANLPTADAWCSLCPFFRAGSTDLERGCPGHESGDHLRRRDPVLDIV